MMLSISFPGSSYHNTTITIAGSGFGSNINNTRVIIGNAECVVVDTIDNQIRFLSSL